ncbi:hypothetical protein GCM10027592_24180 [Spirosoma flavus]
MIGNQLSDFVQNLSDDERSDDCFNSSNVRKLADEFVNYPASKLVAGYVAEAIVQTAQK